MESLGLECPPNMSRKLSSPEQLAINNLDNFVLPSLALLSSLLPRVQEMTKVRCRAPAASLSARLSALAGFYIIERDIMSDSPQRVLRLGALARHRHAFPDTSNTHTRIPPCRHRTVRKAPL